MREEAQYEPEYEPQEEAADDLSAEIEYYPFEYGHAEGAGLEALEGLYAPPKAILPAIEGEGDSESGRVKEYREDDRRAQEYEEPRNREPPPAVRSRPDEGSQAVLPVLEEGEHEKHNDEQIERVGGLIGEPFFDGAVVAELRLDAAERLKILRRLLYVLIGEARFVLSEYGGIGHLLRLLLDVVEIRAVIADVHSRRAQIRPRIEPVVFGGVLRGLVESHGAEFRVVLPVSLELVIEPPYAVPDIAVHPFEHEERKAEYRYGDKSDEALLISQYPFELIHGYPRPLPDSGGKRPPKRSSPGAASCPREAMR